MNILDELVAKGVTGDVIVAVAKLIADAEVTERVRVGARERMRRVRERSRTLRNGSEQKSTNIEERKKDKEVSVARSARRPKTPLPDNWHPELGGDVEFQKFCDHARANDRRCVDWEAALRNWNRNAPKFNGGNGNGRGRRSGSVLDAFDRIGERLKAAGASDDYVPGSSGPRPLELDTPLRPANLRLVPPR